jgi:hypothetical protein
MQIGTLSGDQTLVAVGTGVAIVAVVGWGLYSHYKNKPTAEDMERGRRAMLHAIGKMGDGTVLEIQGVIVIYSYDVRGVEYTASQDLTALENQLPPDPWLIIGPVSVKYDPRNPANSIILSERWTGLRKLPQGASEGNKYA